MTFAFDLILCLMILGTAAIAQPINSKASLAQADGQAIAQLRVIFYKQDTHDCILSVQHQPDAAGDDA